MHASTRPPRWDRPAPARFPSDARGGVGLTFGLVLPVLMMAAAGAVDYTVWVGQVKLLRGASDVAALAAARELPTMGSDSARVQAVAEAVARVHLEPDANKRPPLKVVATALDDRTGVKVVITQARQYVFAKFFVKDFGDLRAEASAKVASRNICVIGLEPTLPRAINLDGDGTLSAMKCSVYSNSQSNYGIELADKTRLTTEFTCTAVINNIDKGQYQPKPEKCSALQDPLAKRPQLPASATCTKPEKLAKGQTNLTLNPGTYCGGLTVQDNIVATMNPGNYFMKDGPLKVATGGTLKGVGVGIILVGDSTGVCFEDDTVIDLSAPTRDEMAGILVFEDRKPIPIDRRTKGGPGNCRRPKDGKGGDDKGPDDETVRAFEVHSNAVRQLTGTIYMSLGVLLVDADNKVAEASPYTAVVARRVDVRRKANLILNSNYGATDVPVPPGLGPTIAALRLEN